MRLIIISGRSGSGKSTALHMLEDLGYYCVDNLPAGLMPALAAHAQTDSQFSNLHEDTIDNTKEEFSGKPIAIGIDARNIATDLSQFPNLLKKIPSDIDVNVVFLDAKDATLIKRFSETRRKHPLSNKNMSLSEALATESKRLDNIAALADLSIDTSEMNLHQLRQLIRERVVKKTGTGLSLMFQSFGYKDNIPIDSDLVFDVRCLPNPYWQVELRELTGKDPGVQKFLSSHDEVSQMTNDIKTFLQSWLPHFELNNRSYLTISIGCTGGQHRSVYIAEALFKYFNSNMNDVQVRHRELISSQNTDNS